MFPEENSYDHLPPRAWEGHLVERGQVKEERLVARVCPQKRVYPFGSE